jgi:hypothetical protein
MINIFLSIKQNLIILLKFDFSWKNEFHDWLHEIQPTINVYLFSNDDIRSDDREEFLRHVSIYHYLMFIK